MCDTASLTWPALRWHIAGKHKGEEIPDKEEIQVTEELPDGYRVIGQYKRGAAAPVAKEPEEKESLTEVEVPKELPEDFMERTKLSLNVHGFPERLKIQIINVLALHPETHDNPNNFANLLAHICSTYSGGGTHAKKIPLIVSEVFGQPTAEVPYAGGFGQPPSGYYAYTQQPGYIGSFGVPTSAPGVPPHYEDPVTKWINYQIWKESKEEEKKKRGEEEKLPSSLEARLSQIEREYQKTSEFLESVLKRLDKQEEMEEQSRIESRFAKLEEKLEDRNRSGQQDWLQAYLAERDKREEAIQRQYQETIKELGDKLAEATKEVAKIESEIDSSIAEAIARERAIKEDARKELEAVGWGPKTKTKEELDYDIQKTVLEIIPEKIDKGFDKIADKVQIGSMQHPQPITGGAKERPQRPRTPQEIAKQTEIEETILEEAKKREKA